MLVERWIIYAEIVNSISIETNLEDPKQLALEEIQQVMQYAGKYALITVAILVFATY